MARGTIDLKGGNYRMRLVGDLAEIGRDRWDTLVRSSMAAAGVSSRAANSSQQSVPNASQPVSPDPELPAFLRFDYLHCLAQTGCVGPGTGWQPLFLTLWRKGELVAATPLYAKSHSYGEYVFDWSWADAYERHGLEYYPKLLAAIPFTPVCGQRLLAVDEPARLALIENLLEQARLSQLSSLHLLFASNHESRLLHDAGLMLRHTVQFHWQNAGYRDFDEFLQTLAQPKRKKIKAERRKVAQAGVQFERLIGTQIGEANLDFFFRCYERTYAEHRSTPYLNREFFRQIGASMPEHLVLIIARRDSNPIAASLLVRDADRLYGRYWGALERVDCLHFETAYYQAIEAAIALGARVLEGGAQGEHKLARGFLPQAATSAHWLAHPEFSDAVDRFLAREGNAINGYLDELNDRTPFRQPKEPAAEMPDAEPQG